MGVQDRSLQLEHDARFHEVEWRAASISWIVMLALMLAGVLGVFGDGWLSRAQAGDPAGPLFVEYERFSRFGRAHRLRVQGRPGSDGTLRVVFGGALIDAFRVVRITPEPSGSVLVREGIEYRFAGTTDSHAVDFELEPARFWLVDLVVATDGAMLRFAQFVYP